MNLERIDCGFIAITSLCSVKALYSDIAGVIRKYKFAQIQIHSQITENCSNLSVIKIAIFQLSIIQHFALTL